MDANLIFVKTPIGDEAVRQSTRVVQRNLRMVLILVDGNLNVGELSAKIGDQRLVEGALRDLEEGGFIALKPGMVLGREETKKEPVVGETSSAFPASQFSTFGNRSLSTPSQHSRSSQFSSFGKPILPAAGYQNSPTAVPEKPVREKRPHPESARDPAKPLALGRWLIGVPLGLLMIVLLIVALYPYGHFKPGLEAAATRLLQAPVRIEAVGFSFLPQPALTLSDVKFGDAEEGSVALVRIDSPWALFGSGPEVLSSVSLVDANFSADFLADLALFKSPPAANGEEVLIQQINVDHLTVTVRDLALRDLSGRISFNAGRAEQATLRNDAVGLRLLAKPSADGLRLDIQGTGWQPLGVALGFNSLQAKGMLQKGKLLIENVDTTFLNGILKGNWLLEWNGAGFSMAGDASLEHLDSQKVTAALAPSLGLEGDLNGSLHLRASGPDWGSLWNGVEARLDADILRGMLHGIDLGDVARGGSGSGSTKFDRLQAALTISANQVIGRDVQISAGVMSASGQFVVGRQRPVDANLVVTMKTSVSTARSPVHVTGEWSNLMVGRGK